MSQGIPLPSDAHSVNFAGDQEYINDVEIANDNLLEVAQDDELGVEYPNVPEISQMGTNAPAFFKSLLPNLKSIMQKFLKVLLKMIQDGVAFTKINLGCQ